MLARSFKQGADSFKLLASHVAGIRLLSHPPMIAFSAEILNRLLRSFWIRPSYRAVGEGPVCDRFESNSLRRLTKRSAARPWFRSLPRASHFSLLVQRKDNQKKAHPVGRARRDAPGPQVSRGFSTVHPCTVEKRAASCRAPCGPNPRTPPRPGAPVDQDQDQKRLRLRLRIAAFLGEICGDTSGEWLATVSSGLKVLLRALWSFNFFQPSLFITWTAGCVLCRT